MKEQYLKYLFWLGLPLSPIYTGLMKLRNYGYDKGFFKSNELNCPVISIGNVVMGGTGKTPHVIATASFLKKLGKKPAIISRGYGGTHKDGTLIVHDGSNLLVSADIAGDEPVMMAETLGNVPVLVNKNRYKAGVKALKNFDVDIILLDDGFQHRALKRDIDIVLLNTKAPFGNGRVFPGGELREDLSSIKRADMLILTKANGLKDDEKNQLKAMLLKRWPEKPVFFSENRFTSLLGLDNKKINITSLKNAKVYGFCGIAQPETFFQALKQMGANILGQKVFSDHHKYSVNDILNLLEQSRKLGCDFVVTTQKDGVKIRDMNLDLKDMEIFQLNMEAVVEPEFFSDLKQKLYLD